MKSRFALLFLFALLGVIILNACGSAPAEMEAPVVYAEEMAVDGGMPAAMPTAGAMGAPAAQLADEPATKLQNGAVYETDASENVIFTTHLIIKSAEMRLRVADSNQAIDRLTQIVGDQGGYIISSRVWNQIHLDGKTYKYATLTIGIPVESFERTLSRLRGISLEVLDETASGEDVTDQYVDLQSQLTNLEATRERIKSFLEDAQNVDEALRINQQLSEIERQIEEIKGRLNYLQDRSSYSTITITLEPDLPKIEPTPTPEPSPWAPSETVENAWKTLTKAYQGIVDVLIWLLLVFIPIFAPPVLIFWLIFKFIFRKPNKPQ